MAQVDSLNKHQDKMAKKPHSFVTQEEMAIIEIVTAQLNLIWNFGSDKVVGWTHSLLKACRYHIATILCIGWTQPHH